MTGNSLNKIDILPDLMLSSLPSETTVHLKDPYDAVALFSHAAMRSVNFRLVGLGEDHTIPDSSESTTGLLPSDWNATKGSSYAFRYKHSQSSLEYLVKVSRLGKKAVVNALAIDDDKVHSFDILIQDFLSSSSFPYTAPSQSASPPPGINSALTKSIVDLFISTGRLSDLWALFKINIVQKLAPGLEKGAEESQGPDDSDAQRQADDENRTHPCSRAPAPRSDYDPLRDGRLPPAAYPRPFPLGGDPLAPEQPRPRPHGDLQPPGWDDEYDVLRVPGRGGAGGARPPNLGDRDLYPQGLGPNDPFRPSGPGLGGGFGGGGMHPSRDDFLPPGQFGDDGDPLRAPRGARFDPPFPGMGPPRGSGGGFGGPGGFGGGGFGGPGGFGGGGII